MASFADVIVTNAKVFTADEHNPTAEALAVHGNRIVYVGDMTGVEKMQSANSRFLDGQGKTLMPGFIDSHFHLLWGAVEMANAQLYEIHTREELKDKLLQFSEENNPAWVLGNGIKYGIVSARQELDAIIADRPIYIEAYDSHTGWANTRALDLAGILKPGKAIGSNGIVVRDRSGMATGELREWDAIGTVMDVVPKPNEAQKRKLLKRAMAQIVATGVTSVHNMNGDPEEMLTYAALEDSGDMILRVYVPYTVKPETTKELLDEAVKMAQMGGEYARGGAVKFFMDGVWESYTALNLEPYADNPEATGTGIWSADGFADIAKECDRLGLQIFVHACGDGAVRRILDGFEKVQKQNGYRDSRHRVEHIEVIHPDDMPRFKKLGVIASMQLLHAPLTTNEGDVWLVRTGEERWPTSFAWRNIKDAGARMVFGSDWSVAHYNPMLGIHAGLTRQPYRPGLPDQKLRLEEYLIGYTREAAYAEFMENEKGQLKEGFLADMVLLSEDIFNIAPEEIKKVKPLWTMVNGKIVYENPQIS